MIRIRPHTVILGFLALILLAGPVWATEKLPQPPVGVLSKIRDLAATVRAKRLLDGDAVLAPLNLGVQVENGVATIWGPVPTAEVAQRAITRMENVAGVLEVKSNFYLDGRRDNPILAALDLPRKTEERVKTAKPDSMTGKLPEVPRSVESPRVETPTLPPKLVTPVAGTRPQAGPKLYGPRPVKEKAGERKEAAPTKRTLAQQIADVQGAQERYRRLRVRVEEQTVIVVREGTNDDLVMEFVRKVRVLPGVRNVLLTDE